MANIAHQNLTMTIDEYLRQELVAPVRSEYLNGHVYAMAGGTNAHNLLVTSLFSIVSAQLKRPCRGFVTDVKVRLVHDRRVYFYYPDFFVNCGKIDKSALFQEGPTVIAEVLSPTSERSDREEKFDHYRSISNLQHYILVHQDRPRLEHFPRSADWRMQEFGPGQVVDLPVIGVSVPIDQLYGDFDF
jgi:Uma2 family endonuclease